MANNMAQKKIFVDVEEEITTVVEQLRRTRAQHVVLVIPQHALLLQSVVNLKLLALEAQKMRKNIVIMTKDVDGIAFAQRAGIATQPYLADENNEQQSPRQNIQYGNQSVNTISAAGPRIYSQSNDQPERSPQESRGFQPDSGRRRVEGIRKIRNQNEQQLQYENINNSGVVDNNDEIEEYERSLEQMRIAENQQNPSHPQEQFHEHAQRHVGTTIHPTYQKQSFSHYADHNGENTTDRRSYPGSKKNDRKKGVAHLPGKSHVILKGFIFSGLILAGIILLLLVLPKTEMMITPKKITIDERVDVTARADQSVYDVDRRLIPARAVKREITFTKTFPSSGTDDVSAQKAQGTITIYNEYDENPQPLVATTRFLAEDGTLFRLVRQTTVPGMKDGEPGKVEALVIADEEGASGNIGPQRFSIPGFAGSPKKDGFYGESASAMSGGGAGGSNVAVVVQEDIDEAERIMKEEVSSYVEEQLRGILRPESEVLLPEALESTIVRSEANVSPGTMGEEFMYEIVSDVRAIVFAQGDVLAVIESELEDQLEQFDLEQMELVLTYDVTDTDFDNEEIKIAARGTASIVAPVDLENFKGDISGKKHDEVLPIIEDQYKDQIEKVTIESVIPRFPSFLANRISPFEFMTSAEVIE